MYWKRNDWHYSYVFGLFKLVQPKLSVFFSLDI